MNNNALLLRFSTTAFVLALAACGGPDASEIDDKSSAVVGTNCRELCRRQVSCKRDVSSTRSNIGRTFNPAGNACANTAEDYLLRAGQGRSEYHCWRGNQALQGAWSEVQPRSDIYRDDAGNATSLVNACASDHGIY
ncbi:MAG: hypothetical protein RIT81_41750 [Deltaproteobacteria bacterium]